MFKANRLTMKRGYSCFTDFKKPFTPSKYGNFLLICAECINERYFVYKVLAD